MWRWPCGVAFPPCRGLTRKCDHWLNRNHGELPQVSLRMAQGTRLNLFTGTSQSCQLRLIKCEKHDIKYGLERWTGFHTYIAKLEFCTNLVLTETTNCNSGWCWTKKNVQKYSVCPENGIAHWHWVVASSTMLLEAVFFAYFFVKM